MAAKRGTQKTKYTPDYVVFDLETTGISRVYDEVVEISAVKVRSGKVVDEFSTLVNPGRHIPAGASQVNGITDQMVADAPRFLQGVAGISGFHRRLSLWWATILLLRYEIYLQGCGEILWLCSCQRLYRYTPSGKKASSESFPS